MPAAHPGTPASEQALSWVSVLQELKESGGREGSSLGDLISPPATPLIPHMYSFREKAV